MHQLYRLKSSLLDYLVGNVDDFPEASVYPGLTVLTGDTTRPSG